MKTVPYQRNPGNACALACYTMAAQYLLPERDVTFEKLAKLADWKKGYVVWGFAVWDWLMDQGIHLIDYDVVDYEAWAKEGVDGLRRSVPEKEFAFYEENTYDLEKESELIDLMYQHPNFTYKKQKPAWSDVLAEVRKSGICDVTLNLRTLNHQDGLVVHRVVILDINETRVVFHDPNDKPGRKEPIAHFKSAFEALGAPELARYWI